ncbi:MAG: uracil-DNA glycosylase [Flavobacteriaceae bacterium]|nr:uracil-DNA glycosylase [Flavobacteriaceae bacterium]MDG2313957.1 uracil-DNA glycosylase [Flavobacteriaceae bacterium]
MNVQLHPSWKKLLQATFEEAYFQQLAAFVKNEYHQHRCYPPGNQVFAALNACPFDAVQVVIIGQDPYHGPNQANGLCFSVHDPTPHPPSLINIFKEIENDIQVPYPKSGDLMRWAQQGVLLLNATLTVRADQAGSHQNKGWETFTDSVIETISSKKSEVVFLLWGGYAKKKGAKIDNGKHQILTSGHPSPLSANRGYWFGNKHFSQCNRFLESKGKKPIDW